MDPLRRRALHADPAARGDGPERADRDEAHRLRRTRRALGARRDTAARHRHDWASQGQRGQRLHPRVRRAARPGLRDAARRCATRSLQDIPRACCWQDPGPSASCAHSRGPRRRRPAPSRSNRGPRSCAAQRCMPPTCVDQACSTVACCGRRPRRSWHLEWRADPDPRDAAHETTLQRLAAAGRTGGWTLHWDPDATSDQPAPSAGGAAQAMRAVPVDLCNTLPWPDIARRCARDALADPLRPRTLGQAAAALGLSTRGLQRTLAGAGLRSCEETVASRPEPVPRSAAVRDVRRAPQAPDRDAQ